MGASDHVKRLVEALAKRLPPKADRTHVSKAVRAAAEALPGSKQKTKAKVLEDEDAIVDELLEKLQAPAAVLLLEEPADEKEAVDDSAEAPAAADAEDDVDVAAKKAEAVYADVNIADPQACLARCSELLRKAMASTRPAEKAEIAVAGLLAVMPAEASPGEFDEEHPFKLQGLRECIKLIPPAVATRPPSMSRLLGFVLAAPARLPERNNIDEEIEIGVLAGRLGAMLALTADGPAAARVAARTGLSSLTHPVSEPVLRRLAPSLPSVVRAAFGSPCVVEQKDAMLRGDLVAALHALRLVSLSRSLQLGNAAAMTEARDLLVACLEHTFDATLLQPQLSKLAVRATGKAGQLVRKRLAGSRIKSKAGAAALVADVFDAVPATSISTNSLRKLADCTGLPLGEDEEMDKKAAAAKAKGDLFFEDVDGLEADPDEDDVPEPSQPSRKMRVTPSVVATASDAIKERALGVIDGVESLKTSSKRKVGGEKQRGEDDGAEEEETAGVATDLDVIIVDKTPEKVQDELAPAPKRRRLSSKRAPPAEQ